MKLYTRTGDDGTTGLFGGGRVGKDDARVEAYGTVDELNGSIGLAAAACPDQPAALARIRDLLTGIQSRLFDIGADLATPAGASQEGRIQRLGDDAIAHIESLIDEVDSGNDEMRAFVLPGGSELAARLHLARTLCRRAERRTLSLHRAEAVNQQTIIYLNRLSDLLFAMARRANKALGVPDVEWHPAPRDDSAG